MRRKRTWIIVGIVVVLIAVGAVVVSNNQQSAQRSQASVPMGRVTEATLSSTIDSSGSVSPETKVTLQFGTSGTVDKVNVQPGDRVKKGDVLAVLDTSDLELQVAQQQQAYLIQQASYSMTLQPDPGAVVAAQTAVSNAEAAYKVAQQKYTSSATDQVLISCNNVDNALQSYNDAQTAYNNYVSNWRVQVDGSADLSRQKARLDSAKAAYDQAVANCSLTKSGVDNSGVQSAAAQLQQAKDNLDALLHPSDRTVSAAKIQLDQAKLALDQAQRQLDNAQIVAPFDGVVTAVAAAVGGPSSGTITLADDSHLHVGMLVDETQVGQIKAGQPAEVTFDALPTTTVTGTVTLINPAGTVSQGVVNYLVRIDLAPTKDPLKIDMTANGRVILDTHKNVLAVPGAAIRTDPKGGYYVNIVDSNGEPFRVDVATGYTDGNLTEVSGDLQPGDRVYLSQPPTQQQRGGPGLFGIRVGG
ncbi:MAG TPA: efflux RND transporter periplasmic adaptor subunit [Anaerolineae bacterium]|nr:efflux RND transporter periplasmic adaptor subunit [Anaerolineae bacterium]